MCVHAITVPVGPARGTRGSVVLPVLGRLGLGRPERAQVGLLEQMRSVGAMVALPGWLLGKGATRNRCPRRMYRGQVPMPAPRCTPQDHHGGSQCVRTRHGGHGGGAGPAYGRCAAYVALRAPGGHGGPSGPDVGGGPVRPIGRPRRAMVLARRAFLMRLCILSPFSGVGVVPGSPAPVCGRPGSAG